MRRAWKKSKWRGIRMCAARNCTIRADGMAEPRACAKSERWRRSKRRKPLKRQQQNKVTRKQNTAKLTVCASEFCGVLFLTVLVAEEPICGKWDIQYENPASLGCSSSQRLAKSEIPPQAKSYAAPFGILPAVPLWDIM